MSFNLIRNCARVGKGLINRSPTIYPSSSAAFNRCFSSSCNDEPKRHKRRIKLTLGRPAGPMKLAEKFNSMWENPDCCADKCSSYRHDVLFLKPRKKRIYTRTWNTCKDVVKKKYVCVGKCVPPERDIRPKPKRKVVCKGNQKKLGLRTCVPPPRLDLPCSRIRLPGCRPTKPRPCTVTRQIKCCKKRCALYPAYSECKQRKRKVPKPTECKCCRVPSTCEVYAMFRKYARK